MMKKCFFLFFICIFSLILGTGCESTGIKNNDWTVSLPNNYEVWHINSTQIVCGKRASQYGLHTVVDAFVAAYCCNDRYIGLIQCDTAPDSENDELYDGHYYIIDSLHDTVYGPMNDEEYSDRTNSLNICDMSDWTPTKPRPAEAYFE